MMIRARIQALEPEWQCSEAASGDEAVVLVGQSAPDYVTMDVNMPGINGFDAAEKIRQIAPAVKVVMLTANIQESSHASAQALGVHFVQKPITDTCIRQAIHHFTGQP
jgi:CheY-like chemotaxis protein